MLKINVARKLFDVHMKPNELTIYTKYFRFKLMKWWAQSYLSGIPKIVVGFRDDIGKVHRLEDFEVNNIPSTVSVSKTLLSLF